MDPSIIRLCPSDSAFVAVVVIVVAVVAVVVATVFAIFVDMIGKAVVVINQNRF